MRIELRCAAFAGGSSPPPIFSVRFGLRPREERQQTSASDALSFADPAIHLRARHYHRRCRSS